MHAHSLPNLPDGTFDLSALLSRSNPDASDPHYARSALVYVENTHNDCGGRVLPKEWTDSVVSACRKMGMAVHLDGARLLNAAASNSDTSPAALCRGFSSVSTCMSKGVGAPVGSVLVGEKAFIKSARRFRKAIGGGATQVTNLKVSVY